jgi:hypothetical protein
MKAEIKRDSTRASLYVYEYRNKRTHIFRGIFKLKTFINKPFFFKSLSVSLSGKTPLTEIATNMFLDNFHLRVLIVPKIYYNIF